MRAVPYHTDPGNPEKSKPDWDEYYNSNLRIIRRMVPDLDDTLLQLACNIDLDLAFIDHKFKNLRGSARPVHEQMKSLVAPFQIPSYDDFRAITEGRAISLLSVCRLRHCMEVVRRDSNQYLKSCLLGSNGELPVRSGKVITSLNVFDYTRYRRIKQNLNIKKGELTAHASKRTGRNLNVELFEGALEGGYSAGKGGNSKGYFRITDFMAEIVYDFLREKSGLAGYQLEPRDHFLPRNPTYGKGNGKWCRSLVRDHGNFWEAKRGRSS